MRTQDVLSFMLAKMSLTCNQKLTKPRRDFLCELFRTLLAMYGRVTFTNLARYSHLSERTFRRHYERAFDWVAFNLTMLGLRLHPKEPRIGVFDTTFIEKAGRKTYGLDRFFSSKDRRQRRGLEVSLLGVVGTQTRRCIGLDATQTPAGLAASEQATTYTRADCYLEQITDCLDRAASYGAIRYWVGDGFYAKAKFFDAITARERHLITRLRSDANLRFLADEGECGPSGRRPGRRPGQRRRYAGKVDFSQITACQSRFEEVGPLDDLPHVGLYTALVNSPHFKRDLRLAVLLDERDGRYVVLATTDLDQMADDVVAFFRLRFQIELLIRDAKQYTGLAQSQARGQAALDFHFNASLAGVNLLRLLSHRVGLSPASYVREQYNRFLLDRLQGELGSEAELDLSHPAVERVVQTGRIAA